MLRRLLTDVRGAVRAPVVVAGSVAASTILVIAVITGGGSGPAPDGTGNLWITTTGCTATPVRQSTPTTLANAAANAKACTFDQAWDAASPSAGDSICIAPGTYNGQSITGNKTVDTTFSPCGGTVASVVVRNVSITDPCPGGVDNQGAAICTTAAHAVFHGFTVDALNAHGYSTTMQNRGDDSEVRNMQFTASGSGSTSFWGLGQRLHVHHNQFDQDDTTPYQRSCNVGDGQPIQFEDNSGVVFEYNHVWQQGSDQTPCSGSSNGFHLDVSRWQGSNQFVIRGNIFEEAEAGTGYIFLSGNGAGVNSKIVGNYFTKNSDGSNWMQVRGDTIGASCPIQMDYNYFADGYSIIDGFCDPINGGSFVGNTGLYQGCGGVTNTANVWWRSSPATCAGSTILTGGTMNTTLGLSAAGRPTSASSPVVNAAETVGPSDRCTDPAYLNSVDALGVVRPFPGNTKCTAGPYEWGG